MAGGAFRRMRKGAEEAMKSPVAQTVPAALLAGHLRRSFARTEWEYDGRDALIAETRQGAVILTAWHGRLLGLPRFWDTCWGRLTTLTSTQYPGRLAGQAFRRFGMPTIPMHDRKGSRGASLPLAREMRAGMSIGIAVDGPAGPARMAKTIPLDWSRLTGAPIWCIGFSMTRFRQLDSWDRLLVPRAGGRGVCLYRRFGTMEKGMAQETERQRLERLLNEVSDAADVRVGHPAPLP